MLVPKKKHLYLLLLLPLLIFLLISIYQLQFFHWSAILDQDITIIYNSLLISSGIEQEYRDHPGYTTFVIYGFFIKAFSIINPNIINNINDLINSKNPNEDIQNLYFFCRIINVFINYFLIFILYKSLIKIKLSKKSAILSCGILIVSGWFTESFFYLRNENLSIIFFLASLIFQIKFFESRNSIFILLSGFIFGIAMLTKIQIVFLFFFQILFILIKINFDIKNNKITKFTKNKDQFLILIYIVAIISYIILQIKLQSYERFDKIRYFDLILILLFNLFILIYFFISNNFNFKKLKLPIVFLSLYFIGYGSSIIFSVFFDSIGLIKLNYYILLRLINPFHYMVEFHVSDYPDLYDNVKVGFYYFYNLFLIAFSKLDYNNIKILILLGILIFSLKYDSLLNSKNKENKYQKKILIFLGIISIIFIMNLRGFLYYYETFVVIPYILAVSYYLKNFQKEKFIIIIKSFLIFYFAYCNFYLIEKRKYPFSYYFSNQSSLNLICDKDKIFYQDVSYKSYLQYYHNKFDDNFIKKLCEN